MRGRRAPCEREIASGAPRAKKMVSGIQAGAAATQLFSREIESKQALCSYSVASPRAKASSVAIAAPA